MTGPAGKADAQLLRDPDFRRYLAARIVSLAGTSVTFVAMPVLVYGLTGSAVWTAAVTVAEGLPYLVLGLLAGATADRVDRRRLMVSADLVQALLLASIPLAHLAEALTAVHVLVVALLMQVTFVFFDAANFGVLPLLAGRQRLVRASSIVFGTGSAVDLVMPAFAGAVMVVLHPAHLVGLDAVTFVGSALLIRGIVTPLSTPRRAAAHQPGSPRLIDDIRDGLRFLWRHPIVRTMTLLGTFVSFAGGAFVGLFVVWADRVLGVREGDLRLGLLFGTWGVGAVLGAALLPRLVRRLGNATTTLALLPFSAALLITTCVQTAWWLAGLSLAAWATIYTAFVINAVTVRQLLTPATLQSRVNSTGRMLTYGLGYPIGAAVAGVLAETLSVRGALLATASTVVLAAALAWLSPLRGADVESAAAELSRAEAA